MHCLKSLRTANPGILQLFKNAGLSARVGADSMVLSRTQQPVPLPCWAAASPHTHRAYHHQQGPDEDQGHSKSRLMSSMEDLLFYTITDGKEMIPLSQFISALRKTGLLTSDPRLRDCVYQMRQSTHDSIGPVMMDKKLFRRCVGNNIMLLTKAFRKKFIIPDFQKFVHQIGTMYDNAHRQEGGQVADYIPQLAKFSSDLWGVSLCTIDGQRHSVGDTKVPFCLQSCVKPLEYAIAVHELGSDHVHQFVGKEPSGLKFNKLSLNEEDKPHNPMVNAGAIVISSLIKMTPVTVVTYVVNRLLARDYVPHSDLTELTHEIPGPLIKCATATEGFGLGLSMGVWVLVANYSLRNECRAIKYECGPIPFWYVCNTTAIFYLSMKSEYNHKQPPGHRKHIGTWTDELKHTIPTSDIDTQPSSKPHSNKAERFDYVMEFLKSMAGAEYVGFSNATFQSERETGDRNYAIGYYLKEKKCFPENADMIAALDFYFQLCSIEVTCESGSVMAATLANGGICPITGSHVLSAEAVRNTLSLMHSCGMYDFSGQFAFHVGLPAKSGVSGAVLLVVPNVMGMMCWSPPLDRLGNSVRGIHFCQDLVSYFNFHNYDNLRHFTKKHDPRRRSHDDDDPNKSVVNLMFAAYSGDVSALRRFALSAVNMEQRDYDSRTVLHIAAAEGQVEAVIFLTEICKVNPYMKDRWGNTPLDDAMQFGHDVVVSLLQEYQRAYGDSDSLSSTDEQNAALDTLKSIV